MVCFSKTAGNAGGKGEGAVKKKSFWQRTNRGFWVSMVLLLAVVLYIAATQLMLIPQRKEIQELSDAVNKIWEETTLMTDEQASWRR